MLRNRVCAHQPNDHVAHTIENLTNRGARQPCRSSDVYNLFSETSRIETAEYLEAKQLQGGKQT